MDKWNTELKEAKKKPQPIRLEDKKQFKNSTKSE